MNSWEAGLQRNLSGLGEAVLTFDFDLNGMRVAGGGCAREGA